MFMKEFDHFVSIIPESRCQLMGDKQTRKNEREDTRFAGINALFSRMHGGAPTALGGTRSASRNPD